MNVQERYAPVPLAADTTRVFNDNSGVASFIAVTAGTITISRQYQGVLTALLTAFPVAAGQVYDFRMFCGTHGFVVALAGGASGTVMTQ